MHQFYHALLQAWQAAGFLKAWFHSFIAVFIQLTLGLLLTLEIGSVISIAFYLGRRVAYWEVQMYMSSQETRLPIFFVILIYLLIKHP